SGGGVSQGEELTELESSLIGIWEEVLGVKGIGRTDDFFRLGGHSLKAVEVVMLIQQRLGLVVDLSELFEHSVLCSLSSVLSDRVGGEYSRIPRLESQPDYPLSHAQMRLWVLNKVEGSASSYHVPGGYLLKGAVDWASFQAAFQALLDRHEILRTRIVEVEGEPRQQVMSRGAAHLEYVEMPLQEGSSYEMVREELIRQSDLPLSVSEGEILRVKVMKFGDQEYGLVLMMHHIVSDGWSMEVLVRDFGELYRSFVEGRRINLPDLRIQYKDYSVWQRQRLESGHYAASRNYWSEELSGTISPLMLPTDWDRPQVKSNRGSKKALSLSELKGRLEEKALQEGCSVLMVLMSGLTVLFHRYTGQEEIVLGFPVAGRDHADLSDQVGFYVNTLILRSHVTGSESYDSVLEKVRRKMLGAYKHQDYPIDRIIEDLGLHRNRSRSQLFDVLVNLTETGLEEPNLWGIPYMVVPVDLGISKFDMTFNFHSHGLGLDLEVEYNSDLYSDARLGRLLDHYRIILGQLLTQGDSSIGSLDYLSRDEHTVLRSWETGANDGGLLGGSILKEIREQVRLRRTDVAIEDGESQISYWQLGSISRRVGQVLRDEYGVGAGEAVGLIGTRDKESLLSLLGIMESGGAFVPIDDSYPEERKRWIAGNSGMRVAVVCGHAGRWV
ncbi:condensation domain-containing protein, partial [Tolypothrix sp. VBCCA 56010]|uniref:condensation domain-containing protein n=1 Tax=Tolypothrix sp. VBCCA 56010 TaxID=3137731 RepID=UPI003D7DE20B